MNQPNPTINDIVTPIVAQALTSATGALQQQLAGTTQDLQQRVTALEQQLADALAAQAPHLVAEATAAGTAVLTNLENDPVTQRIVVCGIIGAALVGALVILVCALLGDGTAQHYIAAAPALLGGAVLWVSKVGVALPARATVQGGAA